MPKYIPKKINVPLFYCLHESSSSSWFLSGFCNCFYLSIFFCEPSSKQCSCCFKSCFSTLPQFQVSYPYVKVLQMNVLTNFFLVSILKCLFNSQVLLTSEAGLSVLSRKIIELAKIIQFCPKISSFLINAVNTAILVIAFENKLYSIIITTTRKSCYVHTTNLILKQLHIIKSDMEI